jgi:fructose 5-dehydrogenase cytochrome subunit
VRWAEGGDVERDDAAASGVSLTAAWWWSLLQRLLLVTLLLAYWFGMPADAQTAPAPADATLVEKGRYLAIAGDCAACHTNTNAGKPFAGGYSIQSPLGVIVATNITPSKTAGIGHYTEAQFARALRQGVRADGSHLYPAMPYTAYTQLTDEDTRALYAYFMHGVAPVDEVAAATGLPFPFNVRASMAVWNLMFLDDRRFVPDASRSQQVNRGAYLANALTHCGTCHTPRNALMAERGRRFLAGGQLGAYYAPNITPDASGIGRWSDAELLAYLRTGHVAGLSQASGPMAEAVEKSFQHLAVEDLSAIVAYLKTVPPQAEPRQERATFDYGRPSNLEPALRGTSGPNERDSLRSGAALFSGNCASCHQSNGGGSRSRSQFYPALFGNTTTGSVHAYNLVAAILFGVERTVGGRQVLMPRFDKDSLVNPLSDAQIADIANFVLGQYGNPAVSVRAEDVAQTRAGGPRPFLAKIQPVMAPVAVMAALLVLAALLWWIVRRRRRAT